MLTTSDIGKKPIIKVLVVDEKTNSRDFDGVANNYDIRKTFKNWRQFKVSDRDQLFCLIVS
jgi:hypothetical protein